MKVLILTASAGNGHNSTADKITKKILSEYKDAEIKKVDMYKQFANKIKSWAFEKGYAFACNHFVGIYNYFFKKSEKSTYENRDKSKSNKEVYPMMAGVLNEIYSFKPDIIVCTYIFTAIAITNLRRYYNIPATVICMTLDYGVSPYWECATAVDEMFLTDDYMIEPFLKRGFKRNQLIVSGIPVGDVFSEKTDIIKVRKDLGLENKFTLLVARSSFFSLKPKKLVAEFKKIKQPIQILICNGKDKKGMEQIEKYLKKEKLPHNIKQYGYIENLGNIFSASDLILTKGGGLTLTEALTKGVPTLIIDKLPQQEIYNKKYFIDNNLGLSVDKSHSVSFWVNKLLDDKKLYNNMIENINKIRKLNTLDVFLNHIKSYKKADYSIIEPLIDSKKQIIKNVDKKRKEAIAKQKK
ncbi:MAG: glycosyltransferase [Clostridia bacterium]|nr:glycosyltransferase [Clostridia bacterium]